jgi:hypothetical protein
MTGLSQAVYSTFTLALKSAQYQGSNLNALRKVA